MSTVVAPWRSAFPTIGSRFDREFRDLWDRMLSLDVPRANGESFLPPMNVAETDKGYEVTFDVPGIEAKDLTVEVRDGMLRVSGERKAEKEEKGKTFYRIEKEYGAFHRSIPFDVPVDPDRVEASYRDGVLKVALVKMAEARSKKVEVKS